jgi:cytochrome c-type biogenesis protein CcmH/NrfG
MVQRDRSLARKFPANSSRPVSRSGALAASLLFAGCSLRAPAPELPPPPSPAAPAPSSPGLAAPERPRPPQPPRENHLSPATRSLVNQAHEQLAHGDPESASLTLDRAVRIEPNNPLIWAELGKVRLAENDAHQAEVCARKALALASGDRTAQAEAGRVLIDALRAQGRNQEAQEVETRPFMQ